MEFPVTFRGEGGRHLPYNTWIKQVSCLCSVKAAYKPLGLVHFSV